MNDPMLELISGNESPTIFTQKQTDIQRHINETRKEFVGQPEVCAKIMELIVKIRRKQNEHENFEELKRLFEKYKKPILQHLTSRWLVSIIDTFYFLGNTEEKKNALIISTYMNLVIIMDTAMFYMDIEQYRPKKELTHGMTDYGCAYFRWCAGDNIRNNVGRICKEVRNTRMISDIWGELFRRLKTTKNLMNDMAQTQQRKNFWE